MRALLAEDDPTLRDLLQKRLEGWGFRVTAVADGDAAVGFIRDGLDRFDLVVTDNDMPTMKSGPYVGGVDVVTAARTETPPIPCVMHSGTGSLYVRRHVSDMGGVFVSKPATSYEFSEAIKASGCDVGVGVTPSGRMRAVVRLEDSGKFRYLGKTGGKA